MPEDRYRLVFRGEITEGCDLTTVKDNLKSLLKADTEQVERIFHSGSVTIKSNLDQDAAFRYQGAFEKTGARCHIERMADDAPQGADAPTGAGAGASPVAPGPGGKEMVATKRLDLALPPEFQAVQDKDEVIFWIGKPNFTAFIIRGIPLFIVGLLWGSFDYFGFIRHGKIPLGFAVPFFALHLLPFWGGLLNMVRLYLVHGNTRYAFTNKRLMMRSGFWGTDFKAIDYDKISDIEVNVNPIENWLGVGTIQAFSGRVTDKGGRIYDSFIGIENPYDIFKEIKQVSVDIKTDWNYPNAMRPASNPGYNTSYKRR